MFAEQFKQQHSGLVRLRLAVLVLGERTRTAAKDTARVSLAQMELLAIGAAAW